MHRHGGVVLLAGGGEQPLGRLEVAVGLFGGAAGELDQPAQGERPGQPDRVVRPAQPGDGGPELIGGLAVAAKHPQRPSQPEPHPGGGQALGQRHRLLQRAQAGRGPAAVHERDAQRGQDIGLTVSRAGQPGQPGGLSQVADGGLGITEVPFDQPDHLVGDGRAGRRRAGRQQGAGAGQRFGGPGEHQRQQAGRIAGDDAFPNGAGHYWMVCTRAGHGPGACITGALRGS